MSRGVTPSSSCRLAYMEVSALFVLLEAQAELSKLSSQERMVKLRH